MAPHVVDVRMHGLPGLTAAYLVRGDAGTALVDTGPASSIAATTAALDALGVDRLDWIVLTHVHLDHAGACGALAARHPEARVAVHPRGARHVADPSRLWAGVQAVYGARTEELWGRPRPVEAERVVALGDGEAIDLGDRRLQALETPGHAPHHHAWHELAEGDLLAGDAIGMQPGADELWRATTPPAAFDADRALASMERVREAGPARLWLGHFGAATHHGDARAVEAVLDAGATTLHSWVGAVRRLRDAATPDWPVERAARQWLAVQEHGRPPDAVARLDATSDPALDVAGVLGWLEREAAPAPVAPAPA